jgi:hypothetical protein
VGEDERPAVSHGATRAGDGAADDGPAHDGPADDAARRGEQGAHTVR